MKLDIVSCGAVTSVGLDAFQTAAAFRAGIGGFEQVIPQTPPKEALRAARVAARASVRRSPFEWLVNLAARGIREAVGYRSIDGRLGLIVSMPERQREHPAFAQATPGDLVREIGRATGRRFEHTAVGGEGGASVAPALAKAAQMLSRGELDACVIGGVDSLLNAGDISRLREQGRLLEPGNPRGLVPGEGAGFVIVRSPGRSDAMACLFGAGTGMEADHVSGARFSQGRAFAAALQAASDDAAVPESQITFRVSTVNGERYAVWESMFFASRFYRTRREQLPIWYTSSAVGELGAASGAAAIVLAAFGIAGGYAPGPFAMVEAASDAGLRAGCIIGPAVGAQRPPFRAERGASWHVLQAVRPAGSSR